VAIRDVSRQDEEHEDPGDHTREDQEAKGRLFVEGLLAGHDAERQQGAELIDDIR